MARIESEVGTPKGGFMKWIDDRFPFTETMEYHATKYYASKNFNYLVRVRRTGLRRAVHSVVHGHLPDDELQAVG